ncbi:MAG: alpha/beta hydrolase [Candidatus Rokuibacteriota bacterium]|nr:MAG: alpha/beta hydrolase [Candidatus Rokubacteria bacterium]
MELDYEKTFGHFAQAGDVRIHYGDAGEGHPVICLHGTGPGANAWANFRLNAGALADHHRALLVDLPRFGRSEKVVVRGPRLDYLSGVIRAFMDATGIARAHFVGNSMGGQAAIKVAIDAPERVGRMVLVAPAPIGHSVFAPMPTETVRMIADYYAGEGPSYEKMRLLMRSLVYDPASLSEAAIRERYEASIAPEVVAANKGPHWAHQSLEHELDRARCPTLLVWGQDDRASPLDHGLVMLRKMPQARLHVFARCGHSVQLEHPEEFNRLTLDFLAERRS